MKLFLCAQELRSWWIGLFDEHAFFSLKHFEVSPEHYLEQLDQFLSRHEQSKQTLSGVCIVNGPGAFTSTRISLMIANTLKFVYDLPLFVLSNPNHLLPVNLLASLQFAPPRSVDRFAHAYYEKPPHITSPHGDNSAQVARKEPFCEI